MITSDPGTPSTDTLFQRGQAVPDRSEAPTEQADAAPGEEPEDEAPDKGSDAADDASEAAPEPLTDRLSEAALIRPAETAWSPSEATLSKIAEAEADGRWVEAMTLKFQSLKEEQA